MIKTENCYWAFRQTKSGRSGLFFPEPEFWIWNPEFARWARAFHPSDLMLAGGRILIGVPSALFALSYAARCLTRAGEPSGKTGAAALACGACVLAGAALYAAGRIIRFRSVTWLAPAGFGGLQPNEVSGAEFGEPERRGAVSDAVDVIGSAYDLAAECADMRRQYLPVLMGVRKAGKSVLLYDMVCFSPDAPFITWKDARKGRFLFMPEQYQVIRRTLLRVEGGEKRKGAATIEDIRALPEGTKFRLIRGLKEDFPGEWVFRSDWGKTRREESRVYTREEYLSLYESGDDLFWWNEEDGARDTKEKELWQRVWRKMRRRAGVQVPETET